MLDLQGWHRLIPASMFCADNVTLYCTIRDRLKQEDRLFREVSALINALFDRLTSASSKLVLYDINRMTATEDCISGTDKRAKSTE